MNSVRQILEIDKLIIEIQKYIRTPKGMDYLTKLDVYSNFDDLNFELENFKEMVNLRYKKGDVPFSLNLNIEDIISNAKKGSIIDEINLNLLKEFLLSNKETIKYFENLNLEFPKLNNYFSKIKFKDNVYQKINNIISKDNVVLDSASLKLREIRSKLSNVDKELKKAINSSLSKYKDFLAMDSYVFKNGVYTIPISTTYKNNIEGVILDISDSGQTTFIEPLEVLNIDNNRHLLEIEEKEEINRILKELTYFVLDNSEDILLNQEIIGYFDFLLAKCHYLIEINGTVPLLKKEHEFNLYNARHPLLDKSMVVGNDFKLGNEKTMLLISGPNAGGKTIALKTVSTLIYMTKLGFPIPADEGSVVGFFRKIYVVIGDSQSIESNLSTFSAHISILSNILNYITSNDLVIIDELGNGTDPKEGESLSMSIVKYLLQKKCLTLITTHYLLLKQYGLSNKNILSASFIFNEEKIEPTFKILYDVGGKSYGFAIAKKYGLNTQIVDDAIRFYEDNYIDENDKKLQVIEDKERKIFEKEKEIDLKFDQLKELQSTLVEKENKLNEKENILRIKKIEDFDEYISTKSDEIERFLDSINENNREEIKQKLKEINTYSLDNTKKEEIHINDFVLIKDMKINGKVVNENNENITIISDSGFTIKTKKDKCEKINSISHVNKITNIDDKILKSKNVPLSLNLVGNHIDEALFKLDSYLSDCIIKNINNVKIIHGFGTGKLREAIHEHLKKSKYVKKFHLGTQLDGGNGVTIVEIKHE